jgi:hypothetical protein
MSCFNFDMEILWFGIDRAPPGQKSPDYALGFAINLQPPAPSFRDREHPSAIMNAAPRTAPKRSRSHGSAFTLPWNPCSPSRGNPVHVRVEYA